MSKEQIITGLDIGTCFVRTIVAKMRANQAKPQIIGIGQAPSFGLRHGIVVDVDDVVKSITKSVHEAERSSGVSIDRVVFSISGNHIISKPTKGVIAVSRADGEISKEDVDRVISAASTIPVSQNREIFHTIPRSFSVDNQNDIKDPVGMNGVRLEVDALVIEGITPYIKNLTKCISEAGLEKDGMVAVSLAASQSALNKRQKELGVLSLDLGGGTVNMAVFEEGNIIYSCVLPIGSSHITNDIAIGLRGSIDLAEKVKLEYGSAISSEVGKKEMIDLSKLGLEESGTVFRSDVVKIIEARLVETLELVNKELKIINRQGLLPAGVVLLGGGAKMPGLVDLTKSVLKLPAQIGFPLEVESVIDEIDDPAFTTAVGLILWNVDKRRNDKNWTEISVKPTVERIKKWFRDFSP